MSDTQTSEWIEHDGKGMPVPDDTLVLCRFRDGTDEEQKGSPPVRASYWHDDYLDYSNWFHAPRPCGAEIVAYRVVKP